MAGAETKAERTEMPLECTMYSNGPVCYARIIRSADRYQAKRKDVKLLIERQRGKPEEFISKNHDKSF